MLWGFSEVVLSQNTQDANSQCGGEQGIAWHAHTRTHAHTHTHTHTHTSGSVWVNLTSPHIQQSVGKASRGDSTEHGEYTEMPRMLRRLREMLRRLTEMLRRLTEMLRMLRRLRGRDA